MGSKAPAADPQIGIAATKSAETGQMMLDWMKQQAQVTNGWATEDRARQKSVYEPLQDQFIQEAQDFASPERKQQAAAAASADVALAARQAEGARGRQEMAMGINPASGRSRAAATTADNALALSQAGARTVSNRNIEDQGRSLRANTINMGSGLAVNPATSMGISNGAIQSGGTAAMQGFGQQGNLLNTQYQQQMQSWQAQQQSLGGLFGALGTVAGMIPSSKEIKENKRPFDALGAIEGMPVEQWNYKEGAGDGGEHIGPYAEDFQAATGMGDGKSIDAISMIGVTMGAVRQLAGEVKQLKGMLKPMGAMDDEQAEAGQPDDEAEEGDNPMAMGVIPMPKRRPKPSNMRMAA
jgi:hypothetical protein